MSEEITEIEQVDQQEREELDQPEGEQEQEQEQEPSPLIDAEKLKKALSLGTVAANEEIRYRPGRAAQSPKVRGHGRSRLAEG